MNQGRPLRANRQVAALVGVTMVVVAEFLPVSQAQGIFADLGFVLIAVSAALSLGRPRLTSPGLTETVPRDQARLWSWTIVGLGLGGALVTQSWYRSGSVLAGGDIAPPIGVAWIGRIFRSFGWSGDNLGSPTNNQTELPKAAIFSLAHALGASDATAQRLWLSLLVAGIFIAVCALARALGLAPLAGGVVALFYFFNPMTLSQVGIYDNYLTAMILVPALAAAIITYGRSRIRLWHLCVVFMVAAPFLGYVESNPPLVGMVALTTALTPILSWTRFGRESAKLAAWGVLIAGAVLIGVSAYWIVPSLATLHSVASSTLTPLSTWAFTESRSTLTNAFWLNTAWGWSFSFYFPFDSDFSHLPLDLIFGLLPLAAFVGLALCRATTSVGRAIERLRGVLVLGVLGVILLSTGTRPPGNVLFDPLYHLPYGWLLQEPGRFLIVVALGYALLCGLLVQQLGRDVSSWRLSIPRLRRGRTQRMAALSPSVVAGTVVALVALASGFPLWTGAIIPGARQGFPSTHVMVPRDWTSTARYLNSSASPRGALLVLPPDDFYQMPYTWYYGNDSFIPSLLDRNVVVPSAESYATVSAELLRSVRLEATELQDHNWDESGRLLDAIGTPIVLVRGDIVDKFRGRSIISPKGLLADLENDPEMSRIHRDRKLSLFELNAGLRLPPDKFATVNTASPNLKVLSSLPARTVVVTSTPKQGHTALYQLPSSTRWRLNKATISTRLAVPEGWTYSVTSLDSRSVKGSTVTVEPSSKANEFDATMQLPSNAYLVNDGSFSPSRWGGVGNCYDIKPVKSPQYLRAAVLSDVAPKGKSALELSASIDAACVSKPLLWHGGAIELSLEDRTIEGATAHICLWEAPIDRCALAPSLTSGMAWSKYRTIVQPDRGTQTVSLFLYAYPVGPGKPTIEQYADVSAKSLASRPAVMLVGAPTELQSTERLAVFRTGYSAEWIAPPGASHVIVDGMRNGVLVKSYNRASTHLSDAATRSEHTDEGVLAIAMAVLAAGLWRVKRRYEPKGAGSREADVQ